MARYISISISLCGQNLEILVFGHQNLEILVFGHHYKKA
jgi:hypothetical protein